MRRIFIVIILIVCTNILLSCGLASDEKSVEQTSEFEQNQYEEFDNKVDGLSESDLEELKWLIQTLHVSHGGASNILGNGSVLDTKEKQAKFLDILNEMEYENTFKNSLKKYVIFEDDRKFINIENAEIVLKMAGALSTVEVWQYLSQNYSQYMESEDIFEMPLYARGGSDNSIEFRDWEFIVEEDGKLTVRYKIYNPFSYMYIENVDVRLHKNEQSIFGGYSADYLMVTPIESEKTTCENEELFSESDWGEYKKPMTMGKSIDDYIFKLDGSLYQMPCPLDEFLSNGWKYNGKLKKNEKRAEIILTKEGKEIHCIIWYCKGIDNPKWYVVSIRTEFGDGISDVDFELFGNHKRGDYAYGYGSHGIYGFCDPLYFRAGISVDVGGDKMIRGFTMTYAPKYINRIKRLNEIATYLKGEVCIMERGNNELERDISYKLTMYEEPLYVQVKSLDKVGWAKDMNIIWVKKGEQENVIEYIEYGKDFTLFIDDNNKVKIEVVRMEDNSDDKPEVLTIR